MGSNVSPTSTVIRFGLCTRSFPATSSRRRRDFEAGWGILVCHVPWEQRMLLWEHDWLRKAMDKCWRSRPRNNACCACMLTLVERRVLRRPCCSEGNVWRLIVMHLGLMWMVGEQLSMTFGFAIGMVGIVNRIVSIRVFVWRRHTSALPEPGNPVRATQSNVGKEKK